MRSIFQGGLLCGVMLLLASLAVYAFPPTMVVYAPNASAPAQVTPVIVGQSSVCKWAGTSSICTITLNVVNNHDDAVVAIAYAGFGATASVACNDGTLYNVEGQQVFNANQTIVEVQRLRNTTAGVHTITCTGSATAANSFGQAQAYDVTGDANLPVDQAVASTNTNAAPATGATSTLASPKQIVFAVTGGSPTPGFAGLGTPATPGYTNLYLDTADTTQSISIDYKTVNATTPVSAAWGSGIASQQWGAVLVTFQGGTSIGSGSSSSSSSGGSSSSGSSSGAQIKWHPGHYLMSNTTIRSSGGQTSEVNSEISVVNAASSNVRGYAFSITWAQLESSQGVYTFSQIDNVLSQLGTGKKAIIQVAITYGSSDQTETIPSYILSNPGTYGSSPSGQGGYWTSFSGGEVQAAIWRSSVASRLAALYTALGNKYDSSAQVEAITAGPYDETALNGNIDGGSDFSFSGYESGWVTVYNAGISALPHTNIGGALANFTATDISETNAPGSIAIINDQYNNRTGSGWPDTYGNTGDNSTHLSWAQSAWIGTAGGAGFVYAGKMPVFAQVQGYAPGTLDYAFSAASIATFANSPLKTDHLLWEYVTGSGNGDWSSDVVPAINAHPITQTACPPKYTGGCNTN